MVDSKENNKFDMRVKGLSSFANIRASISGEKSSVESNLSNFYNHKRHWFIEEENKMVINTDLLSKAKNQ